MSVTPAKRQAIVRRACGLCEYCHADERWQFVRFTVDHFPSLRTAGMDFIRLLLTVGSGEKEINNTIIKQPPKQRSLSTSGREIEKKCIPDHSGLLI